MAHTKNLSFGYTSTLFRLHHQVDLHIDEHTIVSVYPHEDDPKDTNVGRFDVEVTRNGIVHREYPNLTYPEVLSKIEAYYDIG